LLIVHLDSVVPLLVLGVALLNVAATSRVLGAQSSVLRKLHAELDNPSERPPPIRAIHEAWRARSATWGYLASLIALSFLACIRFLPAWALGDLFPTTLVPLYELSVLSLTVAMIAVLSQYTSRTAAADAQATSRILRALSTDIASHSERSASQLSSDLSALSSRLAEALSQTSRETNTVLAELTNSIRDLAFAAAAQAEVVRRAEEVTAGAIATATRATEEHANSIRDLERARSAELAAEAERLRPRIAVRMRVEGTFIHHVWLDLYDGASQAVGTLVGVRGGMSDLTLPLGNLPTRLPRPLDLGDVTNFPTDGVIEVSLLYSDLAGRQYRARQSFHFRRFVSGLGTTAGWDVAPADWIWIGSTLDVPIETNIRSLPA
jgi:hypothetical protein